MLYQQIISISDRKNYADSSVSQLIRNYKGMFEIAARSLTHPCEKLVFDREQSVHLNEMLGWDVSKYMSMFPPGCSPDEAIEPSFWPGKAYWVELFPFPEEKEELTAGMLVKFRDDGLAACLDFASRGGRISNLSYGAWVPPGKAHIIQTSARLGTAERANFVFNRQLTRAVLAGGLYAAQLHRNRAITIERVDMSARNKPRLRSGKRSFGDHITFRIDLNAAARFAQTNGPLGYKRQSPGFHTVVGHMRRLKNGKVVPVRAFAKGDKSRPVERKAKRISGLESLAEE